MNRRLLGHNAIETAAHLTRSAALSSAILSVFIVLSLLSTATSLYAQPKKEALDASRYGFELEQQNKYPEALFEYNKAIAADPKYPYPVARIGAMYQKLHNYKKAIQFFQRAIAMDSTFDDYNYYNLGTSYKGLHQLDSAVICYRKFIWRMTPLVPEDSAAVRDADYLIQYSEKSIELQKQPKNTTDPIKVVGDINSQYDDFAPAITADGSILYFTSRRPSTNTVRYAESKDFGDDIFASKRDDKGNWGPCMALPSPVDSKDDEGAIGISPDGQKVYYSLCRRPDGFGDCDLYESTLDGTNWSRPRNLGRDVNSTAWDAQPSISPDGNAMYFSSRRFGSIEGSEDIWVSYRNSDGTWGKPVNLGPTINTPYSERCPYIAFDGVTLYFSSNGHPGYGAHDLFMTRKQPDGTWSDPINLGSPINSEGEDEFLTVPAQGKTVYFASGRGAGATGLDIYQGILPPDLAPHPITLVKGLVVDKASRKPLGAKIELADLVKDEPVGSYASNSTTGQFYFPITAGKQYGITASAPRYTFYSQHYTVPDTAKYTEVSYTIELTSVDTSLIAENPPEDDGANKKHPKSPTKTTDNTGTKNTGKLTDGITLNNIFFDFNKATLRKESVAELRNLHKLMLDNPKIKIEISGHTDSIGTAEVNQKLSQDRAEAVREFLVGHGIAATRVIAKGYGATRPVAPNDTEDNRQKNRRTEFRIINRKPS